MNKFAVNLSTIFTEVPFLERFKKARECGFSYVECQFPYAYTKEDIMRELEQHQLTMVLLNLPPGNWEMGDRGIATDPNRVKEFRKSVNKGIEYATGLNVSRIHCMSGIVSGLDIQAAKKVYMDNIQYAGIELAKHNMILLIEPINQFDMPGYFMNDINQAEQLLEAVNLPNVKLQFDFYHIQRIHGNSLSNYKKYADFVGHVQIADVPGRHQPGTGEMNYQKILHYLNETYEGYIGLEYNPLENSEESFEWLLRLGKGGR